MDNELFELFVDAINKTRLVSITVNSIEKGVITRKCVPFDFGQSRKYNDGVERYHFLSLDSPEGSHNLSIIPSQLIQIEVLDECFKPSSYITWKPKWFLKRDWGIYS